MSRIPAFAASALGLSLFSVAASGAGPAAPDPQLGRHSLLAGRGFGSYPAGLCTPSACSFRSTWFTSTTSCEYERLGATCVPGGFGVPLRAFRARTCRRHDQERQTKRGDNPELLSSCACGVVAGNLERGGRVNLTRPCFVPADSRINEENKAIC